MAHHAPRPVADAADLNGTGTFDCTGDADAIGSGHTAGRFTASHDRTRDPKRFNSDDGSPDTAGRAGTRDAGTCRPSSCSPSSCHATACSPDAVDPASRRASSVGPAAGSTSADTTCRAPEHAGRGPVR